MSWWAGRRRRPVRAVAARRASGPVEWLISGVAFVLRALGGRTRAGGSRGAGVRGWSPFRRGGAGRSGRSGRAGLGGRLSRLRRP